MAASRSVIFSAISVRSHLRASRDRLAAALFLILRCSGAEGIMTIHSDWIGLMKKIVPAAFSPSLPVLPEAGFIDGQIKLMGLSRPRDPETGIRGVATWEHLLQAQFRAPIEKMWGEGAGTVVLAFDDYKNVPRAKSITQETRRSRLMPFAFEETRQLPSEPPENWASAMGNRAFKAKVQQMIIDTLPSLLDPPDGCRLIVDWKGENYTQFQWHGEEITTTVEPRDQVGEADIKFTKWASRLNCPMAVEATDGDFIPIALLSTVREIAILRYEQGVCQKDHRSYEWVDVDELRKGLRPIIQIEDLVILIGLTGTDYSRGLPLVGPKRIHLETMGDLMRDRALDHLAIADVIVSRIYYDAFQNHILNRGALPSVLDALQASKLGAKTKDRLPSEKRVLTTVRNAQFLLQYWSGQPADAMEYGFRVGEGGHVQWDD